MKKNIQKKINFPQNIQKKSFKSTSTALNAATLPKFSVEEMLKNYFSPKKIFLNCSACGSDTAAASYKVTRLPRVLILHLKRFAVGAGPSPALNGDSEILGIKKLAHSVKIKEQIRFKDAGSLPPELEGVSYALRAIIRHKGLTPDRGHYVTDVLDSKSGAWVEFDDSSCRKVGFFIFDWIKFKNRLVFLSKNRFMNR